MMKNVIIPAQIRAGRAYLNWSQGDLAKNADVGLSTIRDLESEKRATDTQTVARIYQALNNAGVEFIPGNAEGGPGVRMVANRPNLIRRPTFMQEREQLEFSVEHNGKAVTVLIISLVLDDLGGLNGNEKEEVYLKTFEEHRGTILDAVALAILEPSNFDNYGKLRIRQKDINAVTGSWFKVTTSDGVDIRDTEAKVLVNTFHTKFMERFYATGQLPAVGVWRDRSVANNHVFYFSPLAKAIAGELLQEFNAMQCAQPDLERLTKIPL